jgi:hypothetical protein
MANSPRGAELGACLRSLADRDGDGARFLEVLAEGAEALERAEIPYVLVGGIASATLGRPRFTADIDFLVQPRDARRALEALDGAGFETEETNPHWIFKAQKDGIVIDVIFSIKGSIHLDERMLERALFADLDGRSVRVAAPEDLIVTKAVAHDESSGRHWHDALGVIAACELDWDYLLERAQHGARRVFALLVYAQADDFVVPGWAVERLYHTIYGPAGGAAD